MKPWTENLIKNAAKGIATWISYSLLFSRLRKAGHDFFGQAREQADYVAGKMTPPLMDKVGGLGRQFYHSKAEDSPAWLDRLCTTVCSKRGYDNLEFQENFEQLNKEADMAKTKKKWSFFKVILFLGVLIAVAIFILDRILPKPYEDEDLDDAWAGDDQDDFSETEEDLDEATRPPTADIAYDVTEEDKEEEPAEKKKQSKEDKEKK